MNDIDLECLEKVLMEGNKILSIRFSLFENVKRQTGRAPPNNPSNITNDSRDQICSPVRGFHIIEGASELLDEVDSFELVVLFDTPYMVIGLRIQYFSGQAIQVSSVFYLEAVNPVYDQAVFLIQSILL